MNENSPQSGRRRFDRERLWQLVKRTPRPVALVVLVVIGVITVTILMILPWRWAAPPTTAFILLNGGDTRLTTPRHWVEWKDISPYLPLAIIAAEDQKFRYHRGFDFDSIRESLAEDTAQPRGASTISQQLVKNMYLWPHRSWLRKGLEAYFTVFIESLWPKRRILEVYMNVVEFGPGIYGVGAACDAFFYSRHNTLTPYEAALLATVLPSPHRMIANRPSPYMIDRALWIMQQMEQLGGVSYVSAL